MSVDVISVRLFKLPFLLWPLPPLAWDGREVGDWLYDWFHVAIEEGVPGRDDEDGAGDEDATLIG
jgi:hypothetical protein